MKGVISISADQNDYKKLFLLYYNAVVDILKVYRYRDNNGEPLGGDEFRNKVEEVLKEKNIID